jgi:lauroyl/myristoyl acyltransferase
MAAAAGAPVVPAFCVLDPAGAYRLHVEPALAVSRGAEVEGLRAAVTILEGYVRTHWDQWYDVWGHAA